MTEKVFPTGTAVHKFVSRENWEALPTKGELDPMTLPLKKVYITLTTDSAACDSQESCTRVMQELQLQAFENGEPDIKYNFLIGGDGKIYEGRGWTSKPALAKVEKEYEDSTLDIAYIGSHDEETLPIEMYGAACDVLIEGVAKNYLYVGRFEFRKQNQDPNVPFFM